jgi:hypothetical protein
MTKLIAVAVLLLMVPSSGTKEKDKRTAHFDGLILTVTAVDSAEEKGHHYVAVFVNVKNAGRNAACTSFSSLLKTTFGLEYRGLIFRSATGVVRRDPIQGKTFLSEPRISEMLPGEESSGSYLFVVRNGVSPLEMSLMPEIRNSTSCSKSSPGNFALPPRKFKFDVHNLPAPIR